MLATVLGLWLGGGWLIQRWLVFPRQMIPEIDRAELDLPERRETWWLDTEAGPVEAWFLPGAGVGAANPGPAVVFAHGNAELIEFNAGWLAPYRALGVSVLLVEYRGYGRSAGSPSQRAIVADFAAATERLVERDDVDGQRLIYHGRSIGCGVLAALSRRRPPAAMILQSSFTRTGALAWSMGYPGFLMRDPFRVADAICRYEGPVLLMHGRDDRIIPPSHSRRLHELASNSTLRWYDCGHNDFPVDSPRFWRDIVDFLNAHELLNADVSIHGDKKEPGDARSPDSWGG